MTESLDPFRGRGGGHSFCAAKNGAVWAGDALRKGFAPPLTKEKRISEKQVRIAEMHPLTILWNMLQ